MKSKVWEAVGKKRVERELEVSGWIENYEVFMCMHILTNYFYHNPLGLLSLLPKTKREPDAPECTQETQQSEQAWRLLGQAESRSL